MMWPGVHRALAIVAALVATLWMNAAFAERHAAMDEESPDDAFCLSEEVREVRDQIFVNHGNLPLAPSEDQRAVQLRAIHCLLSHREPILAVRRAALSALSRHDFPAYCTRAMSYLWQPSSLAQLDAGCIASFNCFGLHGWIFVMPWVFSDDPQRSGIATGHLLRGLFEK